MFRGIYCEWVITHKKQLLIPNALTDDDWHKSLGSRFGLIAYIGLPLLLPDGQIFGSICAMDSKVNEFSATYEMLLAQVKDLIESHLRLLYQQSILEGQVSDLQRMEDRMSSLGRVAAGNAHEIRNPLSAMNMYLKALQTTIADTGCLPYESTTDAVHIFEKIQAAARKIEFIIKRVMDFSRPTAPQLTATNVNIAIQRAIDLCAVTVRKAGIQMETDLSPDLPDCLADCQMIEQVLLNLINNATQALADNDGPKRIRITSETASSAIIARVSDSGSGVPMALRDTIFDPFFTTRKTGSGIGLSLVRRIIVDHGGSLEVIPSIWGGAEFKFKIPLDKRREPR